MVSILVVLHRSAQFPLHSMFLSGFFGVVEWMRGKLKRRGATEHPELNNQMRTQHCKIMNEHDNFELKNLRTSSQNSRI